MKLWQQLENFGFAFLDRYEPSRSVLEIAQELGQVAHLCNVKLVQTLKPKQADDADPNTYSGNYGLGAFPMHSDLAHWYEPPRYMVIRCVKGTPEVVTNVLDSGYVISELGAMALSRALVAPRRPSSNNNYLLRLLTKAKDGVDLFRWDEMFIKPFGQLSTETFGVVSRFLCSVSPMRFCLGSPGDTLILDNWRMLHGRSSVPDHSVNRHIERVYLRGIN